MTSIQHAAGKDRRRGATADLQWSTDAFALALTTMILLGLAAVTCGILLRTRETLPSPATRMIAKGMTA